MGKVIKLHQLHYPTCIFVDDNHTLYISDSENHRIMKWLQDSKEGLIVAGGNGKGNETTQFSSPREVV